MLHAALFGTRAIFLLVAYTGIAAACAEPTRPTPRTITEPQNPIGQDARFAELAKRIPGFGGVFYDLNGIPTVYLTDLSYKDAAAAAVAEILGVPAETIQFRQGKYDFASLARWKEQLTQTVLGMDEVVVSTDADEVRNLVIIGVLTLDPVTISKIETVVTRLDIPPDAVLIELTEPVIELFVSARKG